MQFATNHLGHFALALGLHGALASAGNARIVSLSSVGHRRSPVIFDDISFAARPYDPLIAYGQSKTATVLFAVEPFAGPATASLPTRSTPAQSPPPI
jgi:NAD(P)-dependent dehydrogenase (short-subunit alcohol dehydrogenase family)